MTKRAQEIVTQRMAECSAKSGDAKTRGDHDLMYKLNTVWHWLDQVRRDLAAADGEEGTKP